ncbi:NADH-quinone oxidoreductase subunit NuoB [Vulcanisaeta thermophila]|uniref:NADH-quinone oxidoreductase subunit NuoB n=1 Tax=Vulcanisaeta thermophila TaxID=867917 RepID=UPI0008530CB1|nr:NADH-quinone oxidoreductase subunit NuoB [Vulcanisaeta thermophila]
MSLDTFKKWGTKFSIWPVHLVTACCGVEMAHTWGPAYDAERLGSLPWHAPRQTNMILVEGTITFKMARVLRMVWEQMNDPKFVVAMGSCAAEGGIFWNSYHTVPVNKVVPIDSYAVGCPPTPESLIAALRILQRKIESGEAKANVKPRTIDLTTIFKPTPTKQPAPNPPHRITPNPHVPICVEKKVEWPLGYELINNQLMPALKESASKIVVTDVNRICVMSDPRRITGAAKALYELGFDHVKSVNVVDIPHENKFAVEYWVSSYSKRELMPILVSLIAEVPRDNPRIPSLIEIWPSADYMEREMYDFFGVWFEGNPWMGRNFLLDPDTPVKFPLRKDVPVVREFYLVDREFPGVPQAPQPKPAQAQPPQVKPAQQAQEKPSGQGGGS